MNSVQFAVDRLANDLLDTGCVRFGEFTLKSGAVSPIYIDLRRLAGHPQVLRRVARAYAARLRELEYDRIAGIPYAALPIATAIGLELNQPVVYPRKEAKEYGTRAPVEGVYEPGETAVLVDDLATTGASKLEAIETLSAAGLQVRDIVVLVDRHGTARADLERRGFRYHAVTGLRDLMAVLARAGKISAEQVAAVEAFLVRGQDPVSG